MNNISKTNNGNHISSMQQSKIEIHEISQESEQYQESQVTPQLQKKKNVQPQKQEKLSIKQNMNKFEGYKRSKHSTIDQTQIHKNKLIVSHSHSNKQYGLDTEVLRVSFNIILVRMTQELRDTFQTLGQKVYKQYLDRDKYQRQWKLHGNGYFINFQKGYEICVINQNMIYQGVSFVTANNVILPDVKGILIDKDGVYQGQFHKGVAQGKGKYTAKNTGAVYNGEWQKGIMTYGTIENDCFKFKGGFQDRGIADGAAAIVFKKTKSKYVGQLKQGKYFSKNATAIYQTKDYVYKGQFLDGKKEGKGVLDQRKVVKAAKYAKFRPADQYDGQWVDDYYVTKRKIRQLRKLDAEAGNEMIQDLMAFVGQNKDSKGSKLEGSSIKGSQLSQMYQFQARKTQSRIQTSRIQDKKPFYQKQQSVQPSVRSIKSSKRNISVANETTPSEINIPDVFEEDQSQESQL